MRMGEHKNRDGVEAFQYPEVVQNHYQYRHHIDDHNSERHRPIILEVTWATKPLGDPILCVSPCLHRVNPRVFYFFGGASEEVERHSVTTDVGGSILSMDHCQFKFHQRDPVVTTVNHPPVVITTVSSSVDSSTSSMNTSSVPLDSRESVKTNHKQPSKTFDECHAVYCYKRGVIRATFVQVLRDLHNVDVPVIDDSSPWPLPPRSSVLVSAKEVASALQIANERRQQQQQQMMESSKASLASNTASSVLSIVTSSLKWTTSKVVSILRNENDNSDGMVSKWGQEGDEGIGGDWEATFVQDPDNGDGNYYGALTPIIDLAQTQLAIQQLEEEINNSHNNKNNNHNNNTSLYSYPGHVPIILGTAEWNSWVTMALANFNNNNDNDNKTFFNISASEKAFLLEVLEEMKIAKIIRRRQQQQKMGAVDLIVLYPSNTIPTETEGEESDQEQKLRIPIALWDLQAAETLIERQIQDWSDKIDECNIQALEATRANKNTVALHFMRKRKRLQGEIDAASQKLVNIEQAKAAIENAHTNKMIVDVLAGSTQLLKDLREGQSVQQVDDVMIDLQQELEEQKELNDAITASNTFAMGGIISDDDLLKELENLSTLTLLEESEVVVPTNASKPAVTAQKNSAGRNDSMVDRPSLSTTNKRTTKNEKGRLDSLVFSYKEDTTSHESVKRAEAAS
ncbi:Snf7 family protein [Nitzschia inconspicua]|uniref:Snf7 family protein n=1 Tax=Nitzschia inconspicua TaxID=303405 RepID=A0A9K3LYM0_9STRA|nr:Snf7 family protein [Nitzschia inconspicua]